eukprot:TRINITY_DN12539_c0_g1_i1.p1 TRINITY_DN12539_c0_g1~~TRINITY_DN12539_c0_g1_i1.p1  ORF type:complete len:74 (-),score=7.04 TRINITY_DN12539_c0_g1_i1:103-324(-)
MIEKAVELGVKRGQKFFCKNLRAVFEITAQYFFLQISDYSEHTNIYQCTNLLKHFRASERKCPYHTKPKEKFV